MCRTSMTELVCPSNFCNSLPDSASQIRVVLSVLAVTTFFPSSEKVAVLIELVCPSNVCNTSFNPVSRICALLPVEVAIIIFRPSGEKATDPNRESNERGRLCRVVDCPDLCRGGQSCGDDGGSVDGCGTVVRSRHSRDIGGQGNRSRNCPPRHLQTHTERKFRDRRSVDQCCFQFVMKPSLSCPKPKMSFF